jgi:hypothetical protein
MAISASYIIRLKRKREACISHVPIFSSSFASAYSNTDASDQAMKKINVNLLSCWIQRLHRFVQQNANQ